MVAKSKHTHLPEAKHASNTPLISLRVYEASKSFPDFRRLLSPSTGVLRMMISKLNVKKLDTRFEVYSRLGYYATTAYWYKSYLLGYPGTYEKSITLLKQLVGEANVVCIVGRT
ncbi:hypothetical protein SK128_015878 [Halocaridina rubra]|uniref:Uncharacterized protein n=1 Tax=Halocaridina rubra TaxID=373956 RepID=A0AAN9AGA9_HALRR